MTRDLIIGVDAGTSVMKSVAFTLAGEQVALAAKPNAYVSPAPGFVEQDMAATWRDMAQTLHDLAEKIPGLAARALCLAVTGQGDGTWLVDARGEPVGGGLLWLDSRAAKLAADFATSAVHAAHYQSTGTGHNACQQSAQIAWMQMHQPERLAQAASAHHCKDWLYFKLTGERASDPSEACFTFGDFRSRTYSREVLERLDIGQHFHLLPPIVDGRRENHPLCAAAADETGLPQGLPIVLGYVDVVCSALGGGLVDPAGAVGCTILGSTGMHMRMALAPEDVRLNAAGSGYTMCLPGDGLYAQMQSNMAATINIDWLVGIARQACEWGGVRKQDRDLLQAVEAQVAGAQPGAALYHPYILAAGERGPFLNADARAQFSGLSSATSLADLFRAVYEGLAFAARDCYAAMGQAPGEIRVTGGAARSAVLLRILASALQAPVRTMARAETGAAGAAMIGALSLGLYPGLAACAAQWATPHLGEATAPDPGLAKIYDAMFPVYKGLREAMPPTWAALRQVREGPA